MPTVRTKSLALSVLAIVGLTTLAAPAAAAPAAVAATPKTFSYSFSSTDQGWIADFADYNPAAAGMELVKRIAPLPTGTADGNGFYLQGHNRSDDLYMFLRRGLGPADGIISGQHYAVTSTVSFWSNSSEDCWGTGGAPASSVHLKAGASTVEPVVKPGALNHLRTDLKKGQQIEEGTEATRLGNIANGLPCDESQWGKVTLTSTTTLTVQAAKETDAKDALLWLNVGTDSGFEGLTQLYYTDISTTLTPL